MTAFELETRGLFRFFQQDVDAIFVSIDFDGIEKISSNFESSKKCRVGVAVLDTRQLWATMFPTPNIIKTYCYSVEDKDSKKAQKLRGDPESDEFRFGLHETVPCEELAAKINYHLLKGYPPKSASQERRNIYLVTFPTEHALITLCYLGIDLKSSNRPIQGVIKLRELANDYGIMTFVDAKPGQEGKLDQRNLYKRLGVRCPAPGNSGNSANYDMRTLLEITSHVCGTWKPEQREKLLKIRIEATARNEVSRSVLQPWRTEVESVTRGNLLPGRGHGTNTISNPTDRGTTFSAQNSDQKNQRPYADPSGQYIFAAPNGLIMTCRDPDGAM